MHISFQYMIDIQIYSNPILAEIEFDTHEMGHLDLDEEISKDISENVIIPEPWSIIDYNLLMRRETLIIFVVQQSPLSWCSNISSTGYTTSLQPKDSIDYLNSQTVVYYHASRD